MKLIRDHTGGKGVDVTLGAHRTPTDDAAICSLALQTRSGRVSRHHGKKFRSFPLPRALINREAEIIGVSDHLASEIPLLLEFARTEKLNLSSVVTNTVPLDAKAINDVLNRLELFGEDVRVVIAP